MNQSEWQAAWGQTKCESICGTKRKQNFCAQSEIRIQSKIQNVIEKRERYNSSVLDDTVYRCRDRQVFTSDRSCAFLNKLNCIKRRVVTYVKITKAP